MDESGFRIFQLDSDIASETEVRILINCARDKTGDVRNGSEDVRKCIGE
jgi:hypothetical protein